MECFWGKKYYSIHAPLLETKKFKKCALPALSNGAEIWILTNGWYEDYKQHTEVWKDV